MKMRAAVLEEFAKPLQVTEVDLAEPKAGRGAGAARGVRGLPHRHVHRVGRRPVRLRADRARATRARASSRSVGEGVSSVSPRRPRGHAVLAPVPRVRALPEPRHEPLPGHPRPAEPGLPARRHHPPVARRRADPPLHGHEHVRRVHRDARDRAGQGLARGRARPRLPVRVRALHRAGRGDEHRQGQGRARPASCSAPAWSASARWPAAGCRAPSGSSASTCPTTGSSWPRGQGATETWVGDENTVQRVLDETGGFGADYTFEATGLVAVMRQAVESARMGWGLCTVAGVAGRGETLDVIPRYLITGRRICGSSFGGVKGRDQVPRARAALPRRPDRRRPVHLPHHHARRRQPRLRADGAPGRDPERHHVQLSAQPPPPAGPAREGGRPNCGGDIGDRRIHSSDHYEAGSGRTARRPLWRPLLRVR